MFTNECKREELEKIARYYFARYNGDFNCEEAIKQVVDYAANAKALDLHDWEQYTVIPRAKNF